MTAPVDWTPVLTDVRAPYMLGPDLREFSQMNLIRYYRFAFTGRFLWRGSGQSRGAIAGGRLKT